MLLLLYANISLTEQRALLMASGQLTQITDAQLGTKVSPLVLLPTGTLKIRTTTEGTPVILSGGALRALALDEILKI